MEAHKKIYIDYFGCDISEFSPCEKCQKKGGHDVHHIHGRGEGMDVIENLMLLCRSCHSLYHDDGKWTEDEMQICHDNFMRMFNIMKNI